MPTLKLITPETKELVHCVHMVAFICRCMDVQNRPQLSQEIAIIAENYFNTLGYTMDADNI